MKSLTDRTAVITGADRSLGSNIAAAFLAEGANLLICGGDPGKLNRVHQEVRGQMKRGQRVKSCTSDLASAKDARELAKIALAQNPKIDILVNNAVTASTQLLLCRALLPHFKVNGG